MEPKKISFGFMKTKKAEKPVVEEKKEFIECLEEKSIKVVGGEQVQDKAPLVITLKPNTLITAERLKQIAEEAERAVQEPIKTERSPSPVKTSETNENETLEQMAVRELLQDAKKQVKVETKTFTVPVPTQPVLSGQKESTLDDYESVPIQEFGLAMLRGMGWAPGKEQAKLKEPQLRPKGLGLGADKVIKKNETRTEKDGTELAIVKNAFVKVINGKHSGAYGKIVSLDEDNGRVVVELPAKRETVSLSEFMLQPVARGEYERESRVINADMYEEYKNTGKTSQRTEKRNDSPKAQSSKSEHRNERRDDDRERREHSSNGRKRDKRSPSQERKKHRKDKKRYSSNESLSSSDSDHRKHRKKHTRKDRSDSDSSTDKKKKKDHKRDIDKKRKGKKKRRDRDRSPSSRKHRR